MPVDTYRSSRVRSCDRATGVPGPWPVKPHACDGTRKPQLVSRGFLLRGSRLIRSARTENNLARSLHSLSIGQSQAARGRVGLHDIDCIFFLIGS